MSSPPFDGVTFSGCGNLNFFQAGVAASLQRAGLLDAVAFGGASAGSGLAAWMAAGRDAEHAADATFELLARHEGANLLRRPDITLEFVDRFLATLIDDDVFQKMGDRVTVSITVARPLRNWRVHRFVDPDDLRAALRASCHLPSWRHRTVLFRGRACFDGGFTSNTPLVGTRCLTISPFPVGRFVDIAPSKPINPLQAVIIPTRARAKALFAQGLDDGQRYLDRLASGAVTVRPNATTRRRPTLGPFAAAPTS